MPMTLPLDDGFLRRECPHCERQFKVGVQPQGDALMSQESEEEDITHFCPLCHQPAPASAWGTKEQLDHARQLAMSEFTDQIHGMLDRMFSGLNQPGGLVRVEVEHSEVEEPKSLDEPHDMVRVNPPCHEETPLKIPENWMGDVACFECGVRYPVDLIRAEG